MAFRFCFVYFGLFICFTQILGGLLVLPVGELPDLGTLRPTRWLVFFVARHVFHIKQELVFQGSGSGDKTYDWVLVFCLLLIAAVVTALWSLWRRGPVSYVRMSAWFRLGLRFALGSTMVTYGLIKAIPLQMPTPLLTRLLEPFGNYSPMGVLWSSVGAAPAYESFLGCAELLAGVLLFLPATSLAGALICLAESIQVFTLNMTYDVPVKLLSFHLVLLSLYLIAPEASRLLNVVVLDRPAAPSTQPPLLANRRRNRVAVVCQTIVGAYICVIDLYSVGQQRAQHPSTAPKPPLYGIWDVTEMSIDGVTRAPLITDYDRWRRVVFEEYPLMGFQRMDDTFALYTTELDQSRKALKLSRRGDKGWSATWSFEQPDATRLILEGEMHGHHLHMQLHRADEKKFLLLNRGFHWVQEYPFNR